MLDRSASSSTSRTRIGRTTVSSRISTSGLTRRLCTNAHQWGLTDCTGLNIERGSPWENGYCESFNSKLRDELLNGEIFYTLQEAKVIIENWRRHYNTIRPHSSLGYRPPAPEAFMPARPAPQSGPAAPHALTLAPRPSLN